MVLLGFFSLLKADILFHEICKVGWEILLRLSPTEGIVFLPTHHHLPYTSLYVLLEKLRVHQHGGKTNISAAGASTTEARKP